MSSVAKRTFSLSKDQSDFIDAKVASGDYASGSEVIREGLRALQSRDAAIEKWLREEVLPTALELKEHPERVMPIDEAFKFIRDEIARIRSEK